MNKKEKSEKDYDINYIYTPFGTVTNKTLKPQCYINKKRVSCKNKLFKGGKTFTKTTKNNKRYRYSIGFNPFNNITDYDNTFQQNCYKNDKKVSCKNK
jgi:hypothetical protein